MTAIEHVRRTQRVLGAAAVTQALAWGIAVTLGFIAVVAFAGLAISSLRNESTLLDSIALVLGAAVAAAILWRSRHFVSTRRVALWIEERIPGLH